MDLRQQYKSYYTAREQPEVVETEQASMFPFLEKEARERQFSTKRKRL